MLIKQFYKLFDEMKQDIVDIIKIHWHRNETFEQNMSKFNKLFGIPISEDDARYIMNSKNPTLFNIQSIDNYIYEGLKKKYKCPKIPYISPERRQIGKVKNVMFNEAQFAEIICNSYDSQTSISKKDAYNNLIKTTNLDLTYNTYIKYLRIYK